MSHFLSDDGLLYVWQKLKALLAGKVDKADGMNYGWTGSAWDALGASFTVDAITNAEIDTILAS